MTPVVLLSVMAARLDPELEAGLRAARLTYPEVGHTAGGLPFGYRTFVRSAELHAVDFEAAAHDLLHWQAHQRAGLRVAASNAEVVAGAVVILSVGIGRLALRWPCRVVSVVNEPRS